MLTLQRLQELLSYEPITGKFTWLVQQGRKRGISLIDAITTPLNLSRQGRKRNV